MTTKGQSKEIALMPVGNKQLDPIENFVPNQLDLRNGYRSSVGNWIKRYARSPAKWDLGVYESVVALIPGNTWNTAAYAITDTGKIFKLLDTPVQMANSLINTGKRPYWRQHNAIIEIFNGGWPIKIENGNTDRLGGEPPWGEFPTRISSYTFVSGYEDSEGERTEFRRCASGNPENYTSGDTGFWSVKKDADEIKHSIEAYEKLYHFKDNSIEIWGLSGSVARVTPVGYVEGGLGGRDTVVKTENGLIFYLGDDFNFRVLSGSTTRAITPPNYKKEIDSLSYPQNMYGIYFSQERLIRWFAQNEGKCFVYSPDNNIFSEDNEWSGGQFQRMNIASYMEFQGKQYVGDWRKTGKIYEWGPGYEDDDGNNFPVYRKFAGRFFENNRTGRVHELIFRLKRGEGISGSGPIFSYRYRFDQGFWSDVQTLNLGEIGDRDPYIVEKALGRGKEIEVEIWETESLDFILTSASIRVEEMN